MKRENTLNAIGLCLLAACFLFALQRVFDHKNAHSDEGRVVLRFAHWQLEGGLRDAFDRLARDYEALHPGVRVEQLAIPERTYAQWVKTQLVGGTAPEIIQLGAATDEATLARFFSPISEVVSRANPYNAGTPLADTPLRETILDGMVSPPAYRANLLEHYGIPVSMFTVRMYYNREVWRLILGDTPTPSNYEEFVAILSRVDAYNRRTGSSILPIAGSKANAPMLINTLVQSQTQRLVQERIAGPTLRTQGTEIGLSFLRGEWSLEHPAFLDGLHIARETGLHMQPGFLQLGREDASFYFLQGRALMITTGSWDSPSFRAQVNFDIGVFPIPLPGREHPRYGRNLYGHASEAEAGTGLTFGVTRFASQTARATDFLLFLASQPHNAAFSRLSGWLPSVVGVTPPPEVVPFLPIPEGYVPGFDFNLAGLGASTQRVMNVGSNRLYSPQGSPAAFIDAVRADLPEAIKEDVMRNARQLALNVGRQDVALIAYLALSLRRPETPEYTRKLDETLESQNALESNRTRNLASLVKFRAHLNNSTTGAIASPTLSPAPNNGP